MIPTMKRTHRKWLKLQCIMLCCIQLIIKYNARFGICVRITHRISSITSTCKVWLPRTTNEQEITQNHYWLTCLKGSNSWKMSKLYLIGNIQIKLFVYMQIFTLHKSIWTLVVEYNWFNSLCRQSITIGKLLMDQKRDNSNMWNKLQEQKVWKYLYFSVSVSKNIIFHS